MIFNPDITKQATEIIFSSKNQKPDHPELNFNGIPVAREPFTKHLGVHLDSRLNFSKHNICVKSYKMYVRPHLDYGDNIFHNQRMDLMDLIKPVQYKKALIAYGCWQGTSRERIYKKLGWESLSSRRWARRLTTFYKIQNGHAPSYLSNHSFYPYTIKRWKELGDQSKFKPSVQSFEKHLNDFIRPLSHSLFRTCDNMGLTCLAK